MPHVAEFPDRPAPPLTIGISDCLLGNPVRYDGGEASDSFPHAVLDQFFNFKGFCPEVGIGLSVPRPPIRLVARDGIRALGVHSPNQDFSERLHDVGLGVAGQMQGVAGYVLMRGSPSCGLYRVKVFAGMNAEGSGGENDSYERSGRGVFAAALAETLPELPLEETGRLNDPLLRENFVTRTFTYAHWQALLAAGLQWLGLIEFHNRYRYLLLAHSTEHYQRAVRLLTNVERGSEERAAIRASAAQYIAVLMAGLSKPASRAGHTIVLTHLLSGLRRELSSADRRTLMKAIAAYRSGQQPLLTSVQLLKQYLGNFPERYLRYQAYLDSQLTVC